MPKYRVNLDGYAFASVTVETDETDPEAIAELALEGDVPTLCAQCSGWSRDWELELGDDWTITKELGSDKPAVYLEDE